MLFISINICLYWHWHFFFFFFELFQVFSTGLTAVVAFLKVTWSQDKNVMHWGKSVNKFVFLLRFSFIHTYMGIRRFARISFVGQIIYVMCGVVVLNLMYRYYSSLWSLWTIYQSSPCDFPELSCLSPTQKAICNHQPTHEHK